MDDRTFKPKDIAQRFAVGVHKVLRWIAAGELGAVNIASKPGGRPRWRIRAGDLLAFELRRANVKPIAPIRRRRDFPDVPHRY